MFEQLLNGNISNFLSEKGDSLFEFSNTDYFQLNQEKELIEELILLENEAIRQLNFSLSHNRAFIFLLLDICERLQLTASFQTISNIIDENRIINSSRMIAAKLFILNVSDCQQYIDQFDHICCFLDKALMEEEDNDQKILATFANYYLTVISVHPKWIKELKQKIADSTNKFFFLSNAFIQQLISYPTEDKQSSYNHIQGLKDNLFGRKFIYPIPVEPNQFLIEIGSDYAKKLSRLHDIRFADLKNIALQMVAYDSHLTNRGVEPLKTEEEQFIYLKSYGNMHYAKMHSALTMLPIDKLSGDIEIIDWGCGQAIASISFFEYCKENQIKINPTITLIEPSEIVLKRASLHTKTFCPNSKIRTICKMMDDLISEDVISNKEKTKLHLFSNVLDIELFSMPELKKLITETQSGINYFVLASPFITDFKADRVDGFYRHFKQYSSFKLYGEKTNGGRREDEYWNCNNNYKNCRCITHPHTCLGKSKWTRILRVFSVEL